MDKKIKTENTETIRINKYLSNAGVCSRRDADQLTDAGRVTLDGVVIKTGEDNGRCRSLPGRTPDHERG